MLSVAEARAIMLDAVSPLAAENVAIEHAYGRVLAGPLYTTRDQPPFAASAMDGYALASAPDACDFNIVGESAAGRSFPRAVGAGEAIRISTGAPMPIGADGVLIQEDANVAGARLLGARVIAGRHVRPRGGDFTARSLLLERGRWLDPIAVALAASAGLGKLDVVRRPRIAVLAGGDEVVEPGHAAGEDQVYESGSFAVRGLVQLWGGAANRLPPLPDNEDAIADAARAALAGANLLVLIGGASVGPHDHARPALARLGVSVRVDKVAVRPGKPTWFGVTPTGMVLGLPGNPASAIVCAALFLRPLIEAMLGRDPALCTRLRQAPLATALAANGPRETYLRAALDEDDRLHAFEDQDSSLLSVFAKSNALILRPAAAPPAAPEEPAPYLTLLPTP